MKGYWRDEAATAATVRDGWLHTGDIGALDGEGYLQITDRKKDIIVLSGGDNVSPARVEGFLVLQPEINQAMVHGDKHPHVVALLVPDEEFVSSWARQNGGATDLARLAEDAAFQRAFAPAIDRVNAGLSAHRAHPPLRDRVGALHDGERHADGVDEDPPPQDHGALRRDAGGSLQA